MAEKKDIEIKFDDLSAFCYCVECSAKKNSTDCMDILESDGLTQATTTDGCGLLNNYRRLRVIKKYIK